MRHHLRITTLSLRNRLTISVVLIALISTLGWWALRFITYAPRRWKIWPGIRCSARLRLPMRLTRNLSPAGLCKTFANSLVNLQLHGTAHFSHF